MDLEKNSNSHAHTRGVNHAFHVIGFEFAIDCDLPEVSSPIQHLLKGFEAEAHDGLSTYRVEAPASPGAPYVVLLDGDVVQRAKNVETVIDFLLWDVNARAIRTVRNDLALHAGAVSLGDDGILLPAAPDTGKTTLTTGLVAAGFSYLSDEAAIIDAETLRVVPYPRPLWMDRNTLSLINGLEARLSFRPEGEHVHVAPDEIRPGAVGGSCRLTYVIAPRYDPEVEEPVLEPMSRAAALTLLADHSFNLHDRPRVHLDTLRRLLSDVSCHRLVSGSLEGSVRAISELVGC